MKKINKKDINKYLCEYRRLDDYEKLFLLSTTLNPFSNILCGYIFKIIDIIEGDVAEIIRRVKELDPFLFANYPKYHYDAASGMLIVSGKMTGKERNELLSISLNRQYKNAIDKLFLRSQNAHKKLNAAKTKALNDLKEIALVCDIGSIEYFIEFVKYVKTHHFQAPKRNEIELRPFNIISNDNKLTVEINNFAKQEDFINLFNKYLAFKESKNLIGVKTGRTRKSISFERQVIAYNERNISERKREPLKITPEVYNRFLQSDNRDFGKFDDDATIRKSKRRIEGMLHAITYVIEHYHLRKNFDNLPSMMKRYF